jgi:prepilin-type N-terminal cleavage/methylation domain-containing protein
MKTRPDKALGEAGFTLLETIVALVILSAALLVFYEFLSGALNASGRARTAADRYDWDRNALELATTLNPMATPDGVFDLGPYRVHWHAEPIGTPRRNTAYPQGAEGQFTIALYRVILDFPDNREFAPVEVTKLGYVRKSVPGEQSAEPAN